MATKSSDWLCCQLGAREHYAIPRALQSVGKLAGVFTDAWVPPGSKLGKLKQNFRERFHPDLAKANVRAWNLGWIQFELSARARKKSGWPLILDRNDWFQRKVVPALSGSQLSDTCSQPTVFSYSYTALEPFRYARSRGWRTVLGQIDAGPVEEQIVARLYEKSPEQRGQWEPAPAEYWSRWREECSLADRIIVNSEWSRRALIEEQIMADKIVVLPLAYEAPSAAIGFQRSYPDQFSDARPLRVLFLGQVNLRKGVGPLFDAIRSLRGEPMEFWFVGPMQLNVPEELRDDPRVRWVGPVPRGKAADYYREADVFIFPTCSDGFGLTQLEAQAWKLPIIASPYCGEVVRDGQNGVVLKDVTSDEVVAALRACVERPQMLQDWATNAIELEQFGIGRLGARCAEIFE